MGYYPIYTPTVTYKIESHKYCLVCGRPLNGKQQKYCSRGCSFYAYRKHVKEEVMEHYGSRCANCGVTDIDLLTLDHIDDNGNEHREELGHEGGGFKFYQYLRKNDYPTNYRLQILCWNCNAKKQAIINTPRKYNSLSI